MLAPIIRLKLTGNEDAAFAYYFVPGYKKKTTSSLCIVAPNALYKYANDGVVECKP